VNEHAAKPLLDAQSLEKTLLFRNGKLDIAGDQISKATRIGDRIEHLVNDFLGESATLAQLSRALPCLFL